MTLRAAVDRSRFSNALTSAKKSCRVANASWHCQRSPILDLAHVRRVVPRGLGERHTHHIAALFEADRPRRPRVHAEQVLRVDGDRLGQQQVVHFRRSRRRAAQVRGRNVEDALEQLQVLLAAVDDQRERLSHLIEQLANPVNDLGRRADRLGASVLKWHMRRLLEVLGYCGGQLRAHLTRAH